MISNERQQLKAKIKDLAYRIKEGRKNKNYVGHLSDEFMYKHIVASLLRGTPLNKIITEDKKQGMIKLNYTTIKNHLLTYGVGHKYLEEIFNQLHIPYTKPEEKKDIKIEQQSIVQSTNKSLFSKIKERVLQHA